MFTIALKHLKQCASQHSILQDTLAEGRNRSCWVVELKHFMILLAVNVVRLFAAIFSSCVIHRLHSGNWRSGEGTQFYPIYAFVYLKKQINVRSIMFNRYYLVALDIDPSQSACTIA